eukprot:TRINITY_DN13669_c0_g1_i1.p1 TRINITY_DN13669_c0_g1~~TRINITY_DN13669_c0_g1_i1.p1  ORF type:complete len:164 (+),score=26.54 TRINITY_DN13669_c0_g1_i1:383-874(+)
MTTIPTFFLICSNSPHLMSTVTVVSGKLKTTKEYENSIKEDDTHGISIPLMRRVLSYCKGYWIQALLVLICIGITVWAEGRSPKIYKQLIDQAVPKNDQSLMITLSIQLLTATILSSICTVGKSYFGSQIGQGVGKTLRKQLYKHLQAMPGSSDHTPTNPSES